MNKNTRQWMCALLAAISITGITGQAQAQSDNSTESQAFQQLIKSYYPLTPKQVHTFKNVQAEQAKANAMPAGSAPAQGTSNIIPVSLKTGITAPIVRIGQGMITSLVFTDKTGKVWPIAAYSVGNPKAFSIVWNKKSGVLMVQGKKLYEQSNVAVMLRGLDVPVMLTLLVGQNKWDYLDYIRVQAYNAKDSGAEIEAVGQAPAYLIQLLSNLPPKGAVKLITSDEDVQVWQYKKHYLMLTRATLLSPAWTARQRGSGPTPLNAYELPVAPVILLSKQGQTERVTVRQPLRSGQ